MVKCGVIRRSLGLLGERGRARERGRWGVPCGQECRVDRPLLVCLRFVSVTLLIGSVTRVFLVKKKKN